MLFRLNCSFCSDTQLYISFFLTDLRPENQSIKVIEGFYPQLRPSAFS